MNIAGELRAPRVQQRADFFHRLERALESRFETPSGSIALFVAHLEAFSLFNDCHGYLAGDRLLEQVAARLARLAAPLSAALRCRIELGHLHADEFAVLITGLAEEDVSRVASRLLAQLGGHFDVSGRHVTAQFSLGCAWTAAADASAGPLLGEARSAMRRARALGGGRFEILNDAARKRFALRAHVGRRPASRPGSRAAASRVSAHRRVSRPRASRVWRRCCAGIIRSSATSRRRISSPSPSRAVRSARWANGCSLAPARNSRSCVACRICATRASWRSTCRARISATAACRTRS